MGVTSADAWKDFGYNLDDKVTGASSTDVCTLVAGSSKQVQVDGTKGSLKFDVERLNELEIADGISAGFRTIQAIRAGHPFADFWFDVGIQGSHPIGWMECFVHQAHHLLRSIGGAVPVGPFAATFEDGYRAAEIAETMLRSWRSGEREKVRYRDLRQ